MISDLASVSPKAIIGADATIGPFTIVHDNVVLGARVTIDSHCVIGYPTPLGDGTPLKIGPDSLIRSHSVFYEGSTFGPGLRTGHQVTVREAFHAGAGLQIGTLCDFQGDSRVGDYVRTHSRVFIAKFTTIGDFAWVFPSVIFANDPHPPSDGLQRGPDVGDYAVIGAAACVMSGVRIGARSVVGAGSLVLRDVEPDTVVGGVPSKQLMSTNEVVFRDGSGRSVYPWMRHFHRGYPEEVVSAWRREFGSLDPED